MSQKILDLLENDLPDKNVALTSRIFLDNARPMISDQALIGVSRSFIDPDVSSFESASRNSDYAQYLVRVDMNSDLVTTCMLTYAPGDSLL